MAAGTIDKAKGRAKSEGKLDQATGKVKDAVDQVANKAKRALRGNERPKRSR